MSHLIKAFLFATGMVLLSLPLLAQPAHKQMLQPIQAASYVVPVEINNHTFKAPKSIPEGWTTLSLTNNSEEHHLMMAHKLPDGVTSEDANAALKNWKENKVPAEWWSEQGGRYGGQGLLAPGKTGYVTILLEPGVYSLVCGFNSKDGSPHFEKGTPTYIQVTSEPNEAPRPQADYEVFYKDGSIRTDLPVEAGRHTFKELFDTYHDVQLAKLPADMNTEILEQWVLEWKSHPPTTFIGGLEPIEPGRTAYFSIDIRPGRYAWVCSKHPGYEVIRPFTVE